MSKKTIPYNPSEADLHRFTEGDCHIFGYAVNRLKGWPLHAFDGGFWLDNDPNSAFGDTHIFTIAPCGRIFDVQGLWNVKKFKDAWGEKKIIGPFEWTDARKSWGGPMFGNYSYKRARLLVPQILEEVGYGSS